VLTSNITQHGFVPILLLLQLRLETQYLGLEAILVDLERPDFGGLAL
jgi:hypothetical protein